MQAARAHLESTIEHEALLHSAILFYTRPFSKNAPRWKKLTDAAVRLIGVDIASTLGSDQTLHDRLITLRDTVIAHSEGEFFPAQHADLTIGSKGQFGIAFQRRSWHVINEHLDLDAFARIATKMKDATQNHLFAIARQRGLLQEAPRTEEQAG